MLIVKGIALGVAMFFALSVIYFLALAWPSAQIDVLSLEAALVRSPRFWVAFGLMLALGCVIVMMRPVRVKR